MSEYITVDIPQGKLRGKKVTSSTNGVTYYSFQGIPYAKPPVGPLRFKSPESPEPWTGTKDALEEGAVAPHIDLFSEKQVGEEDCLFLNVYTPQMHPTSPKAVMVWIHGGGFFMGSGDTDVHGPDFLIAEDVIIVTINYRLGALGFLYLEGTDMTGYNGLRDQVMALKWVKNNIAQFGGDPDNVTIFGESAGGASVHYLMLSPLAEGLFHRAIAQSGTAMLCGGNMPPDVSRRMAFRMAEILGCTSKDPQQIVNFLRNVPADKFVDPQSQVLSEEAKHRVLLTDFLPSEENGPDAFLPASPRTLLREGRYSKVPFMIGVTSGEGKVMFIGMFGSVKLSEIGNTFEYLLPPDLAPDNSTDGSKAIASSMKKFYFGDKAVSDDTVAQFIDLMSDLIFVYPMYETIQSQIRMSSHPTYVYQFDHKSPPDLGAWPTAMNHIPGAPHTAEIPYLFQSTVKPTTFLPGTPDDVFLHKFIKLWTQFAKTGNPSSGVADVAWSPAVQGKQNYLRINGGFHTCTDMYKERMDFLQDLYIRSGVGPLVD